MRSFNGSVLHYPKVCVERYRSINLRGSSTIVLQWGVRDIFVGPDLFVFARA